MSDSPPPDTGAVGSASCVEVTGDTVHIYNFTVQQTDNMIAWNEWFPNNPAWTTQATEFNAETDATYAMSSVFQTDFAGQQEVHLFFSSGGTLNGLYLPIYTGQWWLPNTSLNNLNIGNCIPRAAMNWTDGAGTHTRIYYIQNVSQSNYIAYALNEIAIDNGVASQPTLLWEARQDGPQAFGDGCAAVTWVDSTGVRQYRLYFYDGPEMVEWGKSDTNTGWSFTNRWFLEEDEETRMPMTAVSFKTPDGANHIRLYRHRDRKFHDNAVHEWAWDDGGEKWTDQDLPHDIIAGTYGLSQPSSVAWVTSDGQVHIRLYQLMNNPSLGNYCWIAESSFDTDTAWTANTGVIPLGADAHGP